jgi:hypothetical protein
MSSPQNAAERFGFHLFTLCVALAPVAYGATEPLAASAIGLILAVCLLLSLLVPGGHAGRLWLARMTILLAGIVCAWVLVQAAAWRVAPTNHPTWGADAQLISESVAQLAFPRYAVLMAAGYVLVPLAGFLCAVLLVRDDMRYVWFVQALVTINLGIAAFCIAQYVLAPRWLLWAPKFHYLDSLTGPYVNANTAATHYGLLLIVALGLGLRQYRRVDLLAYIDRRLTTPPEARELRLFAFYAVAGLTFLIALMLTKSRAGILAAFLGVTLLMAGFVYYAVRKKAPFVRALGLSLLSLLGVLAVFSVFGERILLRLEHQGLVDQARLCVYQSIWTAITQGKWWLGTGLGTFADTFPAYRQPACGLYGYWEMAHSVFLEGLLTLGVLFLPCAALAYYVLIKAFAHGAAHRRRYRYVPLTCLGILLMLTVHSLVDFSLQIPGFALAAAAVLGSGAAVSLRSRRT